MGLDDLIGKAKDAFGSERVQDALHSEQAEGISDGVLDKADDFVSGLTGHRFDDAIDQGRAAVDGAIGDE